MELSSAWGYVAVGLMVVGCGGTTEQTVPDGAVAGGGSLGSGGGVGSGGSSGAGGTAGAGGAVDAGPSVACLDGDGSARLAAVARACVVDGDCTITTGQTCCSQSAYGIAKSAVAEYGACFEMDVSHCMTGCASPNWYSTDTGTMTPMMSTLGDALKDVTVHCVAGLCTSDVLPKDAGHD